MKKWVKISLEKYRTIVKKQYHTIYWNGTKSDEYPEYFFDDVNQYYQNLGILKYKNAKNKIKRIFVYIGVSNKENDKNTIYYSMKVKLDKLFDIFYVSDGIRMIDTPQEALIYINERIQKIERKLIKKGFVRICV